MQLTTFTDYSLRVLLYLGAQPESKLSNIKEISQIYNISQHHLSKVIFELGKRGFVHSVRGRNGGIKLAKPPKTINIGTVVRQTENLDIAECFNKETNTCIISPVCGLQHILQAALSAYLEVLDQYTLEDIIKNKKSLQALFQQGLSNGS
ncbi:Rrf2 family transcriptional regulator [Bacillus alkalicellulosilyticus]|uniref:Rrf2 family transcriptional regulator n=1 Tax=Alkalihalobacterium alkalicellulosilyticum TaxID=1912214 RepID=UPI000997C5CD|nr:Rrf2 family transcriptional regulator [Bacillus alkalicellulosilyticus]